MCFCVSVSDVSLSLSPVVPVLHLEDVKLLEVHFLGLPGGLVVLQLSPLDQVVHVVLPVHAEKHSGDGNSHFLFDLAQSSAELYVMTSLHHSITERVSLFLTEVEIQMHHRRMM